MVTGHSFANRPSFNIRYPGDGTNALGFPQRHTGEKRRLQASPGRLTPRPQNRQGGVRRRAKQTRDIVYFINPETHAPTLPDYTVERPA